MSKLKAPFLKSIKLEATGNKAFPFSIPIFENGFQLEIHKPLVIISGENGSGKSTFIEALAEICGFNAIGGSKDHISNRDVDKSIAALANKIRCSWLPKVTNGFFMRAESAFLFADLIDDMAKDFGEGMYNRYGGTSLHNRSHGEFFYSLIEARLQGKGLYIFDEPEAALSPLRQLALMTLINDIIQTGDAQIIIATHSPLLMAMPNAQFLYFKDGDILERNYKTTDHYRIYSRFFAAPDQYIAAHLA